MNVVFLARWYPTPDHPYYGVFIREHAKAVRAAGNEVAVLDVPGVPAPVRGLWRMQEELDPGLTEGIPTYHVASRWIVTRRLARISYWISYSNYVLSVLRAMRRLRRSGFRPDVIHAHVYSAGVPAVIAGKLLRLPVVITEHSTAFPQRTLDAGAAKKARFAFGRAGRVLPVCSFLQDAIEAYGVRADFEVVPNAVDSSVFFTDPRRKRGRGPRRLLFVGNLEPTEHKGFPTLVAALASLPGPRRNWHLDVVGDGPSRQHYERMVEAAGLTDAVTFVGRLSKPAVAETMRSADLFVLPSRFENLPCVIIEAMASGLPVLSTRVGGISEMVTDQDGILVPPADPAALAGALDRMLSSLDTYDSAQIAARAADRYSLTAIGNQLNSIYAGVLAAPQPRIEPSARPET
jgi:L-malate glycosyltransferase